MAESSSSLLCVVLDLNPLAWGLKTVLEAKHAQESGKQQARPETIVQGIDAVLTFINSYLLMTHGNQVAVVGVHPKKTGKKKYKGQTKNVKNFFSRPWHKTQIPRRQPK